jgi:hypothetical protein
MKVLGVALATLGSPMATQTATIEMGRVAKAISVLAFHLLEETIRNAQAGRMTNRMPKAA